MVGKFKSNWGSYIQSPLRQWKANESISNIPAIRADNRTLARFYRFLAKRVTAETIRKAHHEEFTSWTAVATRRPNKWEHFRAFSSQYTLYFHVFCPPTEHPGGVPLSATHELSSCVPVFHKNDALCFDILLVLLNNFVEG